MDFKQFFDDDKAVSPVIGVILMVAITVILAAVIGTFVLGLGDQVQNTTPRASFGFTQEVQTFEDTSGNTSDITTVKVTHESGESISEPDISVTVGGSTAWELTGTAGTGSDPTVADSWDDSSESANAGSTFTVAFYEDGTSYATSNTITMSSSGDGYYDAGAAELASGDVIRVIYEDPNSDNTATLGKYEVQ